jgi:hypothetical protein
VTGDEESGLPGAEDAFGFDDEESEAPDAEKGEGLELESDEDAVSAARGTSLDMEGFENFDEPAVDDTETSSSVSAGAPNLREAILEDLVVAGDYGASDESAPSIEHDVDPTIQDDDDPSLVRTHTSDEPHREARHLGLEELRRRQKRRSGARRLVTATATLVILGGGGFALAYWGVVEIPGITPPERSSFAVAAPVALPGPQPETPVMSHVVFIDSWREAETPRAWADALRERMPDLLGLVTPLSIDGDRQYALVVGPAYSAVDADNLKAPLTTAFDLLNPDPDSWDVREAPYSFFFGEYETLAEANGRVQELVGLAIPAHVLQVTYSGGGSALRVYGGAFSDQFQAGEMGRLLSENDLRDVPLTERRGRLPE